MLGALAELDVHVALLGDLDRVEHRFRHLGEARLHLLGRPQVKLLRLVNRLRRVAHGLPPDAHEAVVGLPVAALDVMHVVGRDQLHAEFLRVGN